MVIGCRSGAGVVDAGGDSQYAARARTLLEAGQTLPPRAEAIAAAQAVEADAQKETGVRGFELHMLAARVLERVYRLEGKEQDAKEAIEIYRNASKDPAIEGACDAALAGAKLEGEIAHDAAVTYRELYRTERRFIQRGPDGGVVLDGGTVRVCVKPIEEALRALAPFRPPARVLEAIDQGLAGEGALAFAPPKLASLPAGAPRIVAIEPIGAKDTTRVVVVLDRPVRFRAGDEASAGGKEPRTFIELDGVDVGAVPRETLVGGIVTRIHADASTTGARVVLDLDGRSYRRIFHLLEPYRIVIDVARDAPGRGRREITRVALDPGHGGTDPGAIGPAGVREKDVTLDVVHKVAPILAKEGLQVVLTRDDDRSVALEERTARANAAGVDLFISVHCNAAENRVRHGVETYVLDTTRDEIGARVAARENATSAAASAEIGAILASMRMVDQEKHATRLAELLQRASVVSLRAQYTNVQDGGVKAAGFYVLVGARMPAVLFETSYISNPAEEAQLATDDYKQRLADGIANAVKAYREGR
jgi:N-acetylmuramoyl-L-alanine amidase